MAVLLDSSVSFEWSHTRNAYTHSNVRTTPTSEPKYIKAFHLNGYTLLSRNSSTHSKVRTTYVHESTAQ